MYDMNEIDMDMLRTLLACLIHNIAQYIYIQP